MEIIRDAFTFPIRGKGVGVLITGGILGVLIDLAALAPLLGFFGVIFLMGYMAGIYFQIIQTSAVGNSEAPEYPEISNIMEDLVWPFLQIFFVAFVSFSPVFAYLWIMGSGGIFAVLLFWLGAMYFPMAMLAVVVLGDIWVIRPTLVIPSIVRVGWFYGLVIVMLVALYYLESLLLEAFGGTMIIGSVVAAFVGMYTLMVNGRILGLIYREKEEELGWL